MVRTCISILVALGFILGLTFLELHYVQEAFDSYRNVLTGLYEKTEKGDATHEDGIAAQRHWAHMKKSLHIWLPHNAIENLDFHLSEALGYLYEGQFTDALPKIEVLIDMTENIPHAFEFSIENIL